uniref:receptor protein-tyrosine kinase n=1 Tax=Romanomermis culicivorax TaxID=13658 RepID=A0A915K469_ROMCU
MMSTLLLITILMTLSIEKLNSKECYGTSNGLSYIQPQEGSSLISILKKRYANCTKVIGNLEISHLTDRMLAEAKIDSFDFLSEIREVTGYVLIFGLSLSRRSLNIPNLLVIHGSPAFFLHKHNNTIKRLRKFALFIASNDLEKINLPNLLSVGGGLGLISNKKLCYWKTINFGQWLGDDYRSKLLIENNYGLCNNADFSCEKCDHCFGPTSLDCQKIFYTNCSKMCNSGLCFEEKGSLTCCHEQCKFGCSGSSVKECLYCKNYSHKELCLETCPARYHGYGGQCVRFCPDNTISHKGRCVLECPHGYYESFLKTCKKCDNSCLKSETCIINESITSRNIRMLRNCRKVQGFLRITDDTFKGGVGFTEDHHIGETLSLLIVNCPNLVDLDLQALKQVTNGDVIIHENGQACVVDIERWSKIAPKRIKIRHNPLCDKAHFGKE